MDEPTEEERLAAIENYLDSLQLEDLKERAREDLQYYYCKQADHPELMEFMDEWGTRP